MTEFRFQDVDRRFGDADRTSAELALTLEHLTQSMDRLESEIHTAMIAFMSMPVLLTGILIALLKL